MNRVLFLSGLDPTGAAGILMDVRVASFLGVNSSGITTCLVVENAFRVEEVLPVKRNDFESLLKAVLEESTVRATKIGLVPEESFGWLSNLIEKYRDSLGVIVMDPVLSATSGYRFQRFITDDFKKLISLSDIVTPNYQEALKISGENVSLEEAGKRLLKIGARTVIITGYPVSKSKIRDYLFTENISRFYEGDFMRKKVRGTGCVFSSAIACFLVLGFKIEEAVSKAFTLVKKAIQKAELISEGVFLIRF